MRPYEGIFIFKPNLEEEMKNSLVDKIKNVIAKFGEIKEEEEWGIRKLAYEIQDLREGYYYLIRFDSENGVIEELNHQVRITEEIMRHLVIRLDEK